LGAAAGQEHRETRACEDLAACCYVAHDHLALTVTGSAYWRSAPDPRNEEAAKKPV
jgi:hypothetical protein